MWWTKIIDWISGGLAGKVLDAYRARLDAGNDRDRMAVDLASREIDAQKALALAELGSRFTALPRWTIEMAFAVYVAKVVIWDKVAALGSTDPLTGDVGTWAGIVFAGMFGSSIASKVVGGFISRR